MKSKRRVIFILLAVLLLVAISGWMMVIGRGHTVYLDNKTLEDYQGQTYKAASRVVIYVDGEQVAKLDARDRGMAICIGQKFTMTLEITQDKGGDTETRTVTLDLPYSMDGILVNLPGVLAGLPEEAWLSEFVIAAPEEPDTDEAGVGDEFGLDGDLGLEGEPAI